MAQTLLQTRGLTKQYGSFAALNEVSLDLQKGDIYGLIGRNGAGKTTFFKCVMGLAKPTAGEIEIAGSKSGLNAARRRVGFMISPSFFPYLNPKQNLEYFCRVKGVRDGGETDRLLRLVGLDGVKKPFKTFSLGMKQRLGLAGAMLGKPPIVVLDEPINGLDPQGIADIRAVIQQENRERGTTFIVSSHILSELDLVATRFGFIEQGSLVQEITRADLHERTKKSLIVDVDDGEKALLVLQSKWGLPAAKRDGNRITLEAHFDPPGAIAHALVTEGVALYRLAPQETTLEEYFMHLIGGI
ncbi:MAG: ABC transporter ATP-binding protein [Oscillospiraceae bacterium]|jgi:ABC-2 type transport system ATP-binding protein|nr:ABC transporter ATP-binding protein [Oscillospiraceae bacterium]